jgi:hypothetical protein
MFRATISQVNMKKIHEFLLNRRIWVCADFRSVLDLHSKNAEKNLSKGFKMNGKKRKQALIEETLQQTIISSASF